MQYLKKSALLGAVVLALGTASASAEVICNQEGDCWRVQERRAYAPELKLRVMPDNWKWAENERDRYRWREPGRGHGYWRQGAWIEIR